jgi:hypothetical protein
MGPFPEPDATEIARRSALVPKTLAKLRAGEPVTIVTWGDSVTAGGDAHRATKRSHNSSPRASPSVSQIENHRPQRRHRRDQQRAALAALQKEVLDFKPTW